MARPTIPSNTAEERTRSVVSVDLSGGATTAADELTSGDESLRKAYAGGFTGDSRTAAGRAQGSTLLEQYQMWRQRLAAEAVAKGSPEDIEAKALKKSRKRFSRHLTEGVSPVRSTAMAFEHYKRKGGKSGFSVWSRKVAAG